MHVTSQTRKTTMLAASRGSVYMIGSTVRPPNPHLRPRYTSTPRATTPQPRIYTEFNYQFYHNQA
eukprot:4209301-Amphidinium_carterae.1